MKIPQRKAVSPIIATLLLIAITVAAGVVVYVFVGGLSSSLSKSGGNQVTEQLSMDAFNFGTNPPSVTSPVTLTLRNTGTASVKLSAVYFNGQLLTNSTGSANTVANPYWTVAPQSTMTLMIASGATQFTSGQCTSHVCFINAPAVSAGTSVQVKAVSVDGAIFPNNIVAGSSG